MDFDPKGISLEIFITPRQNTTLKYHIFYISKQVTVLCKNILSFFDSFFWFFNVTFNPAKPPSILPVTG